MNMKKLFVGGITGGILFFLLGWLVYGNLLANYMQSHQGAATGVNRPDMEMDFLYLSVGNLLSGFLIAYIFIKANVVSLSNGLITGATVGFLMGASFDCIMYATTFIASKHMILADVIAITVNSAIVGAAVGFVMGKLNKST